MMTDIIVTLTVGGERVTKVENYNAKAIAEEISKSPDPVVAVGDVTFGKNFFVSTSLVKVTEETVV